MSQPNNERQASDLHVPVLLQRCVDLLAPALMQPGSVVVDGTLGMGGHSEAILEQCPTARVIGIDRDPAALELAGARLARFGARFIPVHATYDEIDAVVDRYADGAVQGVLLDLGVSSLQLDDAERGFSYARPAPLDMRMDTTTGVTAAELLATASEAELRRILWTYGEEKFAPRIAGAIVRARAAEELTTSVQLADIVKRAVPMSKQKTGGHPAKRTFQAVRIAVNAELEVLEDALPRAVEVLAVDGRIVVEAYHSLEDRLVKRELARGVSSSAPRDWPIEPETHRPYLELLIRGAEKADGAEIERNPRSTSVRLRAARRTRPTPDHMRSTA